MSKIARFAKKVSNITGVVLILLGSIPTPVIGQVSDNAMVEMAGAMDISIATSYAMLLDGTEDPTAEPTAEPAQEPEQTPLEINLDPTPTLEIVNTEEDLCPNDNNKLEPGVCGCGVPDVDSDGDGKLDCKDECPQDESNTCLESVRAEAAQTVTEPQIVENVVEVVADASEKQVVLANEDGEPLKMAAQETADLLVEGDPLIVRGGVNYYFLTDCTGISAPDVCTQTTTPLSDAVVFANPGETVLIAAGTYNENVLVDKNIILIGGSGGVNVTSFILSHPVTSLASWTNINTDLVYIITDSNSQGSIQDGVDLVSSGGEVKVDEGTYSGGITVDKPVEISGNVGDPNVSGPGKNAPVIKKNSGDTGIDIQSGNVTIQGFVFKGFKYGVDVNTQSGVNVNNNMFLYIPTGGEAITDEHTDTLTYKNIEFPPFHSSSYNTLCDVYDDLCDKDEWTDPPTQKKYCSTSAEVVVIKSATSEYFYTKDTQTCDCSVDPYCVTWDAEGCITVTECKGKDISHLLLVNMDENDDPFCGDGNLDAGEICDPAAAPGSAGYHEHCNASCTIDPFCGDGNLDAGETCDPAAAPGSAGYHEYCNASCTIDPYCGDGIVNGTEECEPGVGAGPCTDDCRVPTLNLQLTSMCWEDPTSHKFRVRNPNAFSVDYSIHLGGSGVGSAPPGDSYFWITGTHGTANTTIIKWYDHDGVLKQTTKATNQNFCSPFCGDGIVQPDLGETCDGEAWCRDDCTYCGDSILDAGETCDPAAAPGSAGYNEHCNASCTIDPYCGDGNLDAGETCDPAAVPGSAGYDANCRTNCTIPTCGDGILDTVLGETCDGEAWCRADCTYCGDGIVQSPPEECEPGVGDGACTDSCVVPVMSLTLTSMCWEDFTSHMFRVRNPNPFPVDYTIHLGGSGAGTAPPGDSYFWITGTHGTPNTTIIKWYDHDGVLKQTTKATNQNFCSPFCGDGIVQPDLGETCDGEAWCRADCTYCGDDILQDGHGETCDGEAYCRADCTYCGDAIINGQETCDPGDPTQDYCNNQCDYKEFAGLVLDPGCVGVGTLGWSVINPNPFSVPNVQVVVDGVLRFDGTFPANTEVGMGTTPDGPAAHTMVATWPNGGFGTFTSTEVCEPEFVPPPLFAPVIPVTGETFIIPVTGADLIGAITAQKQLLLTAGAGLLGISLMIGKRKKK